MKKARFLLAAALLVCLPVLPAAQESKGADEDAIRRVVSLYLDSIVRDDAESFGRAVHLKGKWFFQTNTNGLREVSQKQVYTNIICNTKRRVPRVRALPRIVSIDVTNGVASVKAEIDFPDSYVGDGKADSRPAPPGVRQTDYLSLIRFNEGWKIVGKVSTLDRIPAPSQSASAK